jgi:DNA-binding response OmpR family regulator
MDELRARVRALGRRRIEDRTPTIEVGDLVLDPSSLGVTRAGRQVHLTAREFALLSLLARHPGQLFTRERLIETLWDADFAAETANLSRAQILQQAGTAMIAQANSQPQQVLKLLQG